MYKKIIKKLDLLAEKNIFTDDEYSFFINALSIDKKLLEPLNKDEIREYKSFAKLETKKYSHKLYTIMNLEKTEKDAKESIYLRLFMREFLTDRKENYKKTVNELNKYKLEEIHEK
jgi:hypothetical protein